MEGDDGLKGGSVEVAAREAEIWMWVGGELGKRGWGGKVGCVYGREARAQAGEDIEREENAMDENVVGVLGKEVGRWMV